MADAAKEKLYTLKETCEFLGISVATGRNWLRSGRLVPAHTDEKKRPLFSPAFVMQLKDHLADGSLSFLKSRRNKSYVSGSTSYHSYLKEASANHAVLDYFRSLPMTLEETFLSCILRDCAEKLFPQSEADYSVCLPLLQDLVDDASFHHFLNEYPILSDVAYSYDRYEDTLGFLYLSLRDQKVRKGSGSYYTPVWLAEHLIKEHLLPSLQKPPYDASVLDPSCGTGMFLLQLPKDFPLKNLHGSDLDALSIKLARINLAMKHQVTSAKELHYLYRNIFVRDYFSCSIPQENRCTYDIILGNPPWGAKLSDAQKKTYRTLFSCARNGSFESSDLFLEQSLLLLNADGRLSFVLPEAVLTVKSHQAIRSLLLKNTTVHSVEYLGEAFERVHCPSIILTLKKENKENDHFSLDTKVTTKEHSFSIKTSRITDDSFFPFAVTDEEYAVLLKILQHPSHITLKGQADFALGIVTGNNSRFLHSEPVEGTEPVLKGNDISPYHINSHSGYLKFLPEQFQQTAPEVCYRTEKLLYRFISKKLVFAYDNSGLLSLNSCNIVIPRISGLQIKYILAILNSPIAQFVFEKQYSSVKVLRSHLESLPIPLADADTQKRLVSYVDFLISSEDHSPKYKQTLLTLESEIKDLFLLTDEEYSILLNSI